MKNFNITIYLPILLLIISNLVENMFLFGFIANIEEAKVLGDYKIDYFYFIFILILNTSSFLIILIYYVRAFLRKGNVKSS
jgi:hypothetical protein